MPLSRLKAAAAACMASLVLAVVGAPPAAADTGAPVHEALFGVPVFFIAGPDGEPVIEPGAAGPTWYLSRAQASFALGLMRGAAPRGRAPAALRVAAADLAEVGMRPGPHAFMKPGSLISAAADVDGAPLYLVRDQGGAPFTVAGDRGRREVPFFISEKDAADFIDRVLDHTGGDQDDIRLSVISLGVVLDLMLTSEDPGVRDWVIRANDEMRRDARILRDETVGEGHLPDEARLHDAVRTN